MSRSIERVQKIIVNLLISLFSLSCVFPIVWLWYTSLKTRQEYNRNPFSLPKSINMENYKHLLGHTNFSRYFTNSFITSLITIIMVLVISFLTGYIISRFRFRGRNLIYVFFILGMVIPTHAWLLPIFIQFKSLGLLDRIYTLALPYIVISLPIAFLLIESFVKTIPIEMEESSMMEGCNFWQTLQHIILPVSRPVLITIVILTFNTAWNEFPFALVLINKDLFKTIPVALTMFTGAYSVDYPMMIASLCIAVSPVLLLYALFSKRIVEGMTSGAVKG